MTRKCHPFRDKLKMNSYEFEHGLRISSTMFKVQKKKMFNSLTKKFTANKQRKTKTSTSQSSSSSVERSNSIRRIVAASFGVTDITPALSVLFNFSEPRRTIKASTSIFPDPNFSSACRGMVVVSKDEQGKDDEFLVAFVEEDQHFDLFGPGETVKAQDLPGYPIQIITAFYGTRNITKELLKNMKSVDIQDEIQIRASNMDWGDSWPNVFKSMTVVYRRIIGEGRYGPVCVETTPEHELLRIDLNSSTSEKNEIVKLRESIYGKREEGGLIKILGATYGGKDVTHVVRDRLDPFSHKFSIESSNAIFGDTWGWVVKSLIIYYSVEGSDDIYFAHAVEGSSIQICSTLIDHIKLEPISNPHESFIQILGASCAGNDITQHARNTIHRKNGYVFNYSDYSDDLDMFDTSRRSVTILYRYGQCGTVRIIGARTDTPPQYLNPVFEIRDNFKLANNHQIITITKSSTNICLVCSSKEILVSTPTRVLFQSLYNPGTVLNCHNTKQKIAFEQVAGLLIESKTGTVINVEGLLLVINTNSLHLEIPLYEISDEDLVRDRFPTFIRKYFIVYSDGRIPDQPGITNFKTTAKQLCDIKLFSQ